MFQQEPPARHGEHAGLPGDRAAQQVRVPQVKKTVKKIFLPNMYQIFSKGHRIDVVKVFFII